MAGRPRKVRLAGPTQQRRRGLVHLSTQGGVSRAPVARQAVPPPMIAVRIVAGVAASVLDLVRVVPTVVAVALGRSSVDNWLS